MDALVCPDIHRSILIGFQVKRKTFKFVQAWEMLPYTGKV
jgi:hypothetical protein